MIIKILLTIGMIAFIVDYVAYLMNFHQSPGLVNLVIGGVVLFIIYRGVMKGRRRHKRSRYR